MEAWEKELRDKLEKELPDGLYEIGIPPHVAYTGKGGKINFEVELRKNLYNPDPKFKWNIKALGDKYEEGGEPFSEEKLEAVFKDLFKRDRV